MHRKFVSAEGRCFQHNMPAVSLDIGHVLGNHAIHIPETCAHSSIRLPVSCIQLQLPIKQRSRCLFLQPEPMPFTVSLAVIENQP